YLLINRYLLASILISLVICVASIANDLKFELRNEPLLFSDLIWLKDINLIFSFLNVKYLILFIFLILFAIVLYLGLFKTIRKKTIEKSLLKRLILLSIPIFILGFVFNTFKAEKEKKIASNIPIISKLNNNYDIGWLSFAENARYKSVAYVWIKQITKPIIEKPNNYSKNTISSLVSKYTSIAEDINKIRTESISDQTVIFILSESFSDPSRLTDMSVSQDVIPNIRNIISQNTGGIMTSDGYGGGTANMEFQALTGVAYRSFSDSVSIAYTEIVPKLSYIPSISNAFSSENRYVVHPASSTNYNRKNIYSTLDFKSFIAHINSDEPLENVEVVGANISDKTAYSNVLNHLDENNQFFSVITMQNHIPHVLDTPENIIANGAYLSEEENATISSYARLISVTDDETRQFLEKLSEIDKKITVVFYGDHLPGIYPDYVFEENPKIQYMTDFFIWSNYQTNKTKFNRVYSSDFIAALLEHTNSKVTPYQALLTKVAEESNSSNDNGEALNDLRLLEYDLTEGKNYLQDSLDFFE
ncbi:TPA: LTA synthase family protein, partial [Streptococcus suis]